MCYQSLLDCQNLRLLIRRLTAVDSYIDYLYHANNLYKYPQQIILIVFLKSSGRKREAINPAEFNHYTESEPVVNVYFQKQI